MSHCHICSKKFDSKSARIQHQRDSHGIVAAGGGGRGGGGRDGGGRGGGGRGVGGTSSRVLNSSRNKSRSITFTWPAALEGIEGEWVLCDEFHGGKSFGFFICRDCNKTWISAHSRKIYKQGCKRCEAESHPYLLWRNFGYYSREESRDIDKGPPGPHDSARCEACREGNCTGSIVSF